MRVAALSLLVVACGSAGGVAAQDEAVPDLEFLEYLGSWQDDDEEWLVVADELMGRQAAEGEAAPEFSAEESAAEDRQSETTEETDED